MKTPVCTYEIARRYILDSSSVLGPEITNLLLGKVRARDLKGLACISDNFDMLSLNVNVYRVLRQVSAFFKKNATFVDDAACLAAARHSFERGERICKITNRRLDYYFFKRDRLDPDLESYIVRAESWISSILGPFDAFMSELPDLLRVTGGATATTPRSESLPYLKLSRRAVCTPACRPYLEAAYRFYGYAAPRVKPILWNRVEFVPKSWKTHRTIACEPAGNLPFQLAFDTYVKRRLRRKTRINLSSQEQNQRHAYEGSITGGLATIDLSMASDTVSMGAVGWLIPADWYSFLTDVRSPFYRLLGGEMQRYHKFSSMGNGATFALETLIFASFLHAVGSKEGLAYGDDLTVETHLVDPLLKLLKFFGFVPNIEKSYYAGPFRESCGKDYYEGIDITPFYIRKTAAWDVPNTCHLVNGLAQLSAHGELWEYLKRFVISSKLPFSAVGYDTTIGVHLHAYHAYRRRVIRLGNPETGDKWTLYTRALARKSERHTCLDSRTLFLWFLRKQAKELPSDYVSETARPLSESQTTVYTTPQPKFRRKWVVWRFAPDVGLAGHDIFSWSEYVLRES